MKHFSLILNLLLILNTGFMAQAHVLHTTTVHHLVRKKKDKPNGVVQKAKGYLGTRYRYGGLNKKGIDCSGLVYTVFKAEGVNLPRRAADMAAVGKKISRKKVQKGDLIFFKTGKTRLRINHVGIVSAVKNGTIYFIHASSSKGVIQSSLKESYWQKRMKYVRRVL